MTDTLSPSLFSIFTSLIEERVGLSYGLADKAILENKLFARVQEAGFESALDYYYFLRYDDPNGLEFKALVQALVVHETFFFRELPPLRVAVEKFLLPLVQRGLRPRVWCAACATGEEPLSLAMLLAELGVLSQVAILASDISEPALAKAQSGSFGARSLRQAPPAFAERFLTRSEQGVRIAPELLTAVHWRQLNLLDREAVDSLGELDLIVCRNVLIYFADATARRVVASLRGRLRTGGVLVVGVSESLMRLQAEFSCEEHDGAFLYRKLAP